METLVRGSLFFVSGIVVLAIIVAVLEHTGVQVSSETKILLVLGLAIVVIGVTFLVKKMYK